MLDAWVTSPDAACLTVLELNKAGSLHDQLTKLPGFAFGAYPAVDMQAMPYASSSFDLVVHSDTLEHVPDPLQALIECRRVLKPGGALCFTVPIVVGRMSRSRDGMPPSYHGAPGADAADYIVHTEFGADAWTYLARAGFTEISIVTVAYPIATALIARA